MQLDIMQQLERWRREQPMQLAWVCGNRSLAYGELATRAHRVAANLGKRHDGSAIAVRGSKEPEMLVAFFGAAMAGCTFVPLDLSLSEAELRERTAAAGCSMWLERGDISELAGGLTEEQPPAYRQPHDLFCILAGARGERIAVTVDTVRRLVDAEERHHSLTGEVVLNTLPLSDAWSLRDIYPTLFRGGTIFSLTAEQAVNDSYLFEMLDRSGISIWYSEAAFAERCLSRRNFATNMLPRLKRMVIYGEGAGHDLQTRLAERFPCADIEIETGGLNP
jgi:acyl-coenzyme A synthetase/AMP-(fatty) acid ligase